jgi:hypothetical protein
VSASEGNPSHLGRTIETRATETTRLGNEVLVTKAQMSTEEASEGVVHATIVLAQDPERRRSSTPTAVENRDLSRDDDHVKPTRRSRYPATRQKKTFMPILNAALENPAKCSTMRADVPRSMRRNMRLDYRVRRLGYRPTRVRTKGNHSEVLASALAVVLSAAGGGEVTSFESSAFSRAASALVFVSIKQID